MDTVEFSGFGGENASLVHRAEYGKSVFLSGLEVFSSVSGGGVDDSGAVFGRHIIRKDGEGRAVKDGVFER